VQTILSLRACVFWLCFRWVGDLLTPLLHRLKGASPLGAVAEPLAGKPVAVLVVFLLLWVAARFLDHRRFVDYGFHFNKRWWKLFICGVAFGIVYQALPNVIGLLTGQLRVIEIMHRPNPEVTVPRVRRKSTGGSVLGENYESRGQSAGSDQIAKGQN
jgi:hypothetical protein